MPEPTTLEFNEFNELKACALNSLHALNSKVLEAKTLAAVQL